MWHVMGTAWCSEDAVVAETRTILCAEFCAHVFELHFPTESRHPKYWRLLALVINTEGFIKYSNVFEGNKSDCKTIPDIVENLRIQTGEQAQRAVVVIDAGIATEENLALIESKGYDYVCVSRTGHGGFQDLEGVSPKTVMTKDKCELTVQRVKSDKRKDCFMRVKSPSKALKERSMKDSFESRFEQGLEKLKA